MVTVLVCLGSSCYVRGSEEIAATFERLIEEENLAEQVDLRGNLCMEHCSLGVSVQVGEHIYHHVSPDNAEAFFRNEIAPMAQGMRR